MPACVTQMTIADQHPIGNLFLLVHERGCRVWFGVLLLLSTGLFADGKEHGLSIFGPESLKYGKDEPFAYVNPDAAIAGTLRQTTRIGAGNFTKLSPFGLTGEAVPGLEDVFQNLGIKSWDDDEAYSVYGVLAERFVLAPDKKSMVIHLRPEARFADDQPVTADDVIFSYDLLFHPDVNPGIKLAFKGIGGVEKIGEHAVNVTFTYVERALPLSLAFLTIYPKHIYGAPGKMLGKDFDDVLPVGSGPYAVESYVFGRTIVYRRRDNYWGKDITRLKGVANWQRIEYHVYYDDFSKIEALKSGYLDCLYGLPRDVFERLGGTYFDKHYIVKQAFPLTRPAAMICWMFNLRRPLFQDRELRRILISLYDFDYINKNFYYGENERIVSWFNNQPQLRGAAGPAQGTVRELLRDLAKKHNRPEEGVIYVPEEAFSRGPHELGLDSEGKRIPIEARIEAACKRLDEIGWLWDAKQGVRIREGQRLQFDILEGTQISNEGFYYAETLQRAGINVRAMKLSAAENTDRVKNRRFDLRGGWFDARKAPSRELAMKLNSGEADEKNSANIMGLKNPAIDEVLHVLANTESQAVLETYSKVFDRIMCANWYVIPRTWPKVDHIAYWNYLRGPRKHASGLWAYYPLYWYWWFDPGRDDMIQAAMKHGIPFVAPPGVR